MHRMFQAFMGKAGVVKLCEFIDLLVNQEMVLVITCRNCFNLLSVFDCLSASAARREDAAAHDTHTFIDISLTSTRA